MWEVQKSAGKKINAKYWADLCSQTNAELLWNHLFILRDKRSWLNRAVANVEPCEPVG